MNKYLLRRNLGIFHGEISVTREAGLQRTFAGNVKVGKLPLAALNLGNVKREALAAEKAVTLKSA